MATFNKELHTALMERKQFALAALVVDGHITDGKSLMIEQQANPAYFAQKKQAIKQFVNKLQEKYINGIHNKKNCDCVDCVDAREKSNFIWAN
jgi:hypothetical protein